MSSRPGSSVRSRPGSTAGSKPGSIAGSRPGSSAVSRPGSSSVSRPGSSSVSRPGSTSSQKSNKTPPEPNTTEPATSPRPDSKMSMTSIVPSRPSSSAAWNDNAACDPIDDEKELIEIEENPPKGCWHRFTYCLTGMWATRDLTNRDNREIVVRTTIRELVVYCIFVVILCILTFGMTSSTMFYYTKVMTNLFDKYKSVTQVDEFWTFMEQDLMDGLYWEYMYNDGSEKNFICPGGEENIGPCPVDPKDRNILYENRLLGLPRLRQLRVKNDSCTVHQDFQNAIKECYDLYTKSKEDHEPFGNGYRKKTSVEAWIYQSEETLDIPGVSGKLGSYSGGGSIQDLHSLKNESLAMIKELKEGLWIGRGTRLVTIDFTVYNANINLFCIANLKMEFSATGGVLPSVNFRTVKLLRYVSPTDFFMLACEIIFICFIIYYCIEEAFEFRRLKWDYFKSTWNYLDLIVISICFVTVFLNIYTHFVVEDKLKALLAEPDKFADFSYLGYWSKQTNNAVAICVFFSWIKLFKYISFNKTMTQLSSTLSRCAKDVGGFGVMFFIVFFAFAQLGYLLFGTQVKDFSSFSDAIFTLLRTILGDFDFHAIQAANRILGPCFFLCYVFFVFFVLLNMFLAIINDTYSEVKAEIASKRNEFEISDYFKRGFNNILGTLGSRNKTIDIEHALKLASSEGTVTYDEVRQNLKKCNFSDLEIEMFFARYDKDGEFKFDPDEIDQMHMEEGADEYHDDNRPLSGKQAREQRSARIRSASARGRPGTAVGGVGGEEFGLLNRRVDRMESSIGSIVSKIDAVLIKLEGMEKSKQKRRATMGKILSHITEDEGADDATKRKQMEELVRKELKNWDESRPGTMESGRH